MKLKILLVGLMVCIFSSVILLQGETIKLKSKTFWKPPPTSVKRPERLFEEIVQETHLFVSSSGYMSYWFVFVVEFGQGKIGSHAEPPIPPFPPDPEPK